MKKNELRRHSRALIITLVGFVGILQLPPVWGGGPLVLDSPDVPIVWIGSPPAASITPDTGSLGILDPATALSNLLAAAAAWEDIPSSSITLPNAGPDNSITGPEGPGDFAVSNFLNYVDVCGPLGNPQISPMIFDHEDTDANGNGDIFDALGLPPGVLGIASAECNDGNELVEGYAIFNGPAVDALDITGEDFRSTMTHELGHLLNFAHSVVNGQAFIFGGSDALFPDGTPLLPGPGDVEIMYPFAGGTSATPHQDDIAIASTLYPEPGMPLTDFGTITGTLFGAPSTPRTGGQIIARNMANPFQDAVSAISGDFLQFDIPGDPTRGTYTLNTLTPGGMYSLEVRDSVAGDFSTEVFVPSDGFAFPSLGPLPGPEEFYSGPDESHSNPIDDPTTPAFLITVPAGGPPSPFVANILLNTPPTVLVANWISGDTRFFKSRVYLWNPSTSAGEITVQVYNMPRPGPFDPPEASELLGTLNLGTLEAESARNIIVEQVLSELIPVPYTALGGNLTLVFTIGAAGVRASAQVFNNSLTLAFGTYPLQEIPSTLNTSPTVLVANWISGDTRFFKSRVYLWNPSTSAGEITVQVYNMPRPGPFDPPEASELLGTLNLGTLEAESARNIIVEQVLSELIPVPYTALGGNLTLVFTIGAAGVRASAQVFNNSLTLAFGTYPLQVIE